LPLYFKLFPGSVSDVVTLKNLVPLQAILAHFP
jgi:hypothetical protein